eukprot:TRINITY_DN2932_c1_g2_i1.p2 TRINITY_DN2932_c1_g2~~TRINITY_DN2932_c1_g2_i1.p2  ORF type:complete len:105 (-),score=2.44 TRINITY_DN2932_c1_g2_i1:66-380(-)
MVVGSTHQKLKKYRSFTPLSSTEGKTTPEPIPSTSGRHRSFTSRITNQQEEKLFVILLPDSIFFAPHRWSQSIPTKSESRGQKDSPPAGFEPATFRLTAERSAS